MAQLQTTHAKNLVKPPIRPRRDFSQQGVRQPLLTSHPWHCPLKVVGPAGYSLHVDIPAGLSCTQRAALFREGIRHAVKPTVVEGRRRAVNTAAYASMNSTAREIAGKIRYRHFAWSSARINTAFRWYHKGHSETSPEEPHHSQTHRK